MRAADLDVLGHVNNAVSWAPIEDELARRATTPRSVELEFLAPVLGGDEVSTIAEPADGSRFSLWLSADGDVRAQASVDGVPAPEPAQGTR